MHFRPFSTARSPSPTGLPAGLLHRPGWSRAAWSAAARRLGLEEVMRMSARESQIDEVNEVTLVGRLSQPAEE